MWVPRRAASRRSWVHRCSSPRATSATWWTTWSGAGSSRGARRGGPTVSTSPRRGGDSSRRLYRPTRTSCTSRCLLFPRRSKRNSTNCCESWTAPCSGREHVAHRLLPHLESRSQDLQGVGDSGAEDRCDEPGASADQERFFMGGNRPFTRPQAHVRHPAPGTRCPLQTGSSPSGAASIITMTLDLYSAWILSKGRHAANGMDEVLA